MSDTGLKSVSESDMLEIRRTLGDTFGKIASITSNAFYGDERAANSGDALIYYSGTTKAARIIQRGAGGQPYVLEDPPGVCRPATHEELLALQAGQIIE